MCNSFVTFGDLKIFCGRTNRHKHHWNFMATTNGKRVALDWTDEKGFESEATKVRVEANLKKAFES